MDQLMAVVSYWPGFIGGVFLVEVLGCCA